VPSHPYQPDRRAVLRAGSASLAVLAAALCAAGGASASAAPAVFRQEPDPGPPTIEVPDHRRIIGLL
jgi:hypothetical protein